MVNSCNYSIIISFIIISITILLIISDCPTPNSSNMPYTSKSGKTSPDFCPSFFPKGEIQSGTFVHGNIMECCCCKCAICCPTCTFQCCMVDCGALCGCIAMCRPLCAPICGLLLTCETLCNAECGKFCSLGPSIPCKAAGCELTCGIPFFEDFIGVWHLGTDMYPMAVPSILFPCGCCPFPPVPGLGQDNTLSGDSWAVGGPTQTKEIKIIECCCGPILKCPMCAPHTACKLQPCGILMEPAFGGQAPFWFCSKCQYPGVKFNAASSYVHPA